MTRGDEHQPYCSSTSEAAVAGVIKKLMPSPSPALPPTLFSYAQRSPSSVFSVTVLASGTSTTAGSTGDSSDVATSSSAALIGGMKKLILPPPAPPPTSSSSSDQRAPLSVPAVDSQQMTVDSGTSTTAGYSGGSFDVASFSSEAALAGGIKKPTLLSSAHRAPLSVPTVVSQQMAVDSGTSTTAGYSGGSFDVASFSSEAALARVMKKPTLLSSDHRAPLSVPAVVSQQMAVDSGTSTTAGYSGESFDVASFAGGVKKPSLLSSAPPPSLSSSFSAHRAPLSVPAVVSTNAGSSGGSSDYDHCKIVSAQKYNKKQETSIVRPTEREKHIKADVHDLVEKTDPVARVLQAPMPLNNLSGHEQTLIQSQSYEITGSSSQPVDKNTFSLDEQHIQISDFEYFKQRYDIVLKYPALPPLQSDSNARPTNLPMEPLCNYSGRETMVADPPVEQWIKEDKASYYGASSTPNEGQDSSKQKRTSRDARLNETCVLLIGGFNVDYFDVYFPSTDVLLQLQHLGSKRSCPAAGILNGHIFAFGGDNYEGEPVRTVESYDVAENEWNPRKRMNLPRSALAGGVFDGRLYALGGRGSSILSEIGLYYSSSEWFDLNRNRWIPTSIYMHDADKVSYYSAYSSPDDGQDSTPKKTLCDDRLNEPYVLLLGGFNEDGFDVYFPSTDVLFQLKHLPDIRSCLSATILNGHIFSFGVQTAEVMMFSLYM